MKSKALFLVWPTSHYIRNLYFCYVFITGIFPQVDSYGTAISGMSQLVFVFNSIEVWILKIVVEQLKMLNIIMCDSWTFIFTITTNIITIYKPWI